MLSVELNPSEASKFRRDLTDLSEYIIPIGSFRDFADSYKNNNHLKNQDLGFLLSEVKEK